MAYKPKWRKFTGYKEADASPEKIRDFIDIVVGGGGEFEIIKQAEMNFSAREVNSDL